MTKQQIMDYLYDALIVISQYIEEEHPVITDDDEEEIHRQAYLKIGMTEKEHEWLLDRAYPYA